MDSLSILGILSKLDWHLWFRDSISVLGFVRTKLTSQFLRLVWIVQEAFHCETVFCRTYILASCGVGLWTCYVFRFLCYNFIRHCSPFRPIVKLSTNQINTTKQRTVFVLLVGGDGNEGALVFTDICMCLSGCVFCLDSDTSGTQHNNKFSADV